MSDVVSGLAGYNYYALNSDGVTYTKDNDTPLADLAPYTYTSLTPNTDYSGKLFWTSVDNAGNEDPTKHPFTVGTVATLNPTPDEVPMGATDVANITAIINKCIAAGAGPGVTVSIDSPKGSTTLSLGNGTTAATDYYRVASQTKTFTARAALMAVDKGLISLDDNLSKYLSGYSVDPTIEQIMNMTSGIYDYELYGGSGLYGLGLLGLSESFTIEPTMAYSVAQIMAIIRGGTAAVPGAGYAYTNSNYYVLATILEAVDPTARSIDEIIQQDILTPLGMVNTYFALGTGTPQSPYAVGYDDNPIEAELGIIALRNVSNQNTAFIWAAGAVVSQVNDMIKWGKELRDGTLLSPATQQLFMTQINQYPINVISSVPYGLNREGPTTAGYGLGVVQVGSWFGHDGSWLGWDSCTMFNPGTGTVITVYENFQTAGLLALTTVWYEIAEYLYPGSTLNFDYEDGGPYVGAVSGVLKPVSSSAAGLSLVPNWIDLPFTLPGTFGTSP